MLRIPLAALVAIARDTWSWTGGGRQPLLTGLLLAAVACSLAAVPVRAQGVYVNLQDLARQYENAQKQDRAKFADVCRQQAEVAEEAIATATSRRTDLTQQVEQARGAADAAREQELQAKKATQAARRAQQSREDALLAEQSAESAYGLAVTELEQARDALDEVILRTLGLPPRAKPATEQERGAERTRFSATQKARLRASMECKDAEDRAAVASREVNRIRTELLKGDEEYRLATEQVAAAAQAEDAASAATKAANVELTRIRRELKDANSDLGAARKVLAQANSFLAQMGVKREKK